jgi:hypothetical protein
MDISSSSAASDILGKATLGFLVVFSFGMLWYCIVSAMKEAEAEAERWARAYEIRDDATVKTFDDENKEKNIQNEDKIKNKNKINNKNKNKNKNNNTNKNKNKNKNDFDPEKQEHNNNNKNKNDFDPEKQEQEHNVGKDDDDHDFDESTRFTETNASHPFQLQNDILLRSSSLKTSEGAEGFHKASTTKPTTIAGTTRTMV